MASACKVLAGTFSCDTNDIKEYRYQSGKTTRPIYAIGSKYFAIGKTKPKDDMGGEWKQNKDQFFAKKSGTILWISEGEK